MDKDSEMGKEWDSNSLPTAFHDKFVQSERILSHILRSPKFILDKYKDELLLNPRPYYFLRLFVTIHTCSASSLSMKVVLRPEKMKISQSLASYAYEWVKYFTNEANVNGMPYSKYCQYTYFMWGLHNKYTPIKKFLEQEFRQHHDHENNVPISLELHNLPATIASLATVHGISVAPTTSVQIHHVSDERDLSNGGHDNHDNSVTVLDKSIKSITSTSKPNKPVASKKGSVQCWLCDGPHTFCECKDLKRLNAVCAKRPTLTKYIMNMTRSLQDDSAKWISIKAILDSYEIDDNHEASSDSSDPLDNSLHTLIESMSIKSLTNVQVAQKNATRNVHFQDDHAMIRSINQHEDDLDVLEDDCCIGHTNLIDGWRDEDDDNGDISHDYVAATITTFLPSINSMTIGQLPSVALDTNGRAQVDSGADRTTTPHRELIHDFRLPNPSLGDKTHVSDAGTHSHKILGYGYFHLRAFRVDNGSSKLIVLTSPPSHQL
mmetsp:Transcript_17203/g.32572  ORF Transcript_17203/g.32572 Transcript_17203/m.32572 type:complete len:491 (+) Transcript_17203:1535-3007(+)